jgi:hypothetical protein
MKETQSCALAMQGIPQSSSPCLQFIRLQSSRLEFLSFSKLLRCSVEIDRRRKVALHEAYSGIWSFRPVGAVDI